MRFEIQAVPDAAFNLVRPSYPWTSAKVDEQARIVDVDVYIRFSEGFDELTESLSQIVDVLGAGPAALGVLDQVFWQIKPLLSTAQLGAMESLTPIEQGDAKILAKEGIYKHWSRRIGDYKVNVRVREREEDSLWYVLAKTWSIDTGDENPMKRSFAGTAFWYQLPTVLFYESTGRARWKREIDPSVLSDAYRCTAAHEFGHAVINATKGFWASLNHQGTSTGDQKASDDAPPYPREGEVDLNLYHSNTPQPERRRFDSVFATEEDVTGLVGLSVHPPWLPAMSRPFKRPDLSEGIDFLMSLGSSAFG